MDIQFDINGELTIIDELPSRLNNPLQARALKQMALRIEQDHMDTLCPYHEESPVVAIIVRDEQLGARVSACCQTFVNQIQLELKPILAEAAALSSGVGTVGDLQAEDRLAGKVLQLALTTHQRTFEFEINRIDRLTLGRLDTETGRQPDVDLANYGAQEKGVSRLHATFSHDNGALFLIDEGGPNGTWINDRRLVAKQPYALRDGDQLYFGRLGVSINITSQSAAGSGS